MTRPECHLSKHQVNKHFTLATLMREWLVGWAADKSKAVDPQEVVAALDDAGLDTLLIDAKLPENSGTQEQVLISCCDVWEGQTSGM